MTDTATMPTAGQKGRNAPVVQFHRMLWAHEYLAAPLPQPSFPIDATEGLTDLGMQGNGDWGNCIIEGTEVQASRPTARFKASYDGPVVRIRTRSGRLLTVTPNHAVLTPRGFTLARFLQEGDDLVCGDLLHISGSRSPGLDFDQPPTPIEKVALPKDVRCRRSAMARSGDFHGDGEFVHGDIEVVSAERPLQREPDTALREPYGHEQIEPARRSKGLLHCACALLQGHVVSWASSLRTVRRRREPLALLLGHALIADPQLLTVGTLSDTLAPEDAQEPLVGQAEVRSNPSSGFPGLVAGEGSYQSPCEEVIGSVLTEPTRFSTRTPGYASSFQPEDEGVFSDPVLFSELALRFPGLVSVDRIAEVDHRATFTGHVYDLATESHWYTAAGIVVHNCVEAGEVHLEMVTSVAADQSPPFNPQPQDGNGCLAVQRALAVWGPSTQPPGPGTDMASYCLWGVKKGLWKAFAPVDHTNLPTMLGLVQAGFGLLIGVSLTDQNEAQFNAGQPWTGGAPDPQNGHCVLLGGARSPTGPFKVGTWGVWWETDLSFITDCLMNNPDGEAFLVVTTEEQAAKFTPQLLADVQALGGTISGGTPPPPPTPPPAPPVPPGPQPSPDEWTQFRAWVEHHAEWIADFEAWAAQTFGARS